ncbi:2-methylaconitate cis-trans isomerase PrpF family protein [Hydrogenophaga sp. BPS33]|uniref:2-methylaconitate cis-trans isomerase PrpF family protein n=1 Tax=Hydrogenophaga sp. BPS33 TaxID=2651974 RepID=UPI0013201087|nr:PrpF domain-containing protein [Hydrogenophaga sp. BPS33]QHE84176.1 PrpF family protein [Hydrogenophaga sp. BPS33]
MAARIPAAFIRGGTSKAIVFHARDLPADRTAWDAIFLRAMGSPDPYGRQLDGMGGGVSSLSKVCVVGAPSVDGADVDYTFAQVQVKKASVDYRGNCGNMSSAIGPFAVDEGLVQVRDGMAQVRIHNTNTHKIIRASFPVRGGRSVSEGDLTIPGVHGTGAPVRLDFLEPGGASTGRLLPTGRALDEIELPEGRFRASLVDAANACVFVDAAQLGLAGTELPEVLGAHTQAMALLARLRLEASVMMSIAATPELALAIDAIPMIALVSSPRDSTTLDGQCIPAGDADLVVRMLSNGQPHNALPLTGSLCTGVAMQIEGSLPQQLSRRGRGGEGLRLAMPSGVLTVAADVRRAGGGWHAASGAFYRTTRRLFEGAVCL